VRELRASISRDEWLDWLVYREREAERENAAYERAKGSIPKPKTSEQVDLRRLPSMGR
jgi:hypothetical protein